MIAHLVVFTFRIDAAPALPGEFAAELSALSARLCDVLKEYRHGPALRLRVPSGDYGVFAVAVDAQALRTYLDDAGHRAITARYARSLFDERHAVQFSLG